MGYKIRGPFKFLMINADNLCIFLKKTFLSGTVDILEIIFMQDNAPSYSVKKVENLKLMDKNIKECQEVYLLWKYCLL